MSLASAKENWTKERELMAGELFDGNIGKLGKFAGADLLFDGNDG